MMVSTFSTWMLAFGALSALALSQRRHHQQALQRTGCAGARTALRIAGAAGLALSLVTTVQGAGWSAGLVSWTGQLTLATFAVALLLTYRAHCTVAIMVATWLLAVAFMQ